MRLTYGVYSAHEREIWPRPCCMYMGASRFCRPQNLEEYTLSVGIFFFTGWYVSQYRTLHIRPKMTLDFMSKSACLMCLINAGWTQQKCQVGPINFRYVVAFWRHHESWHLDQVRSIDDSQFHIKFLFIY